VRLPGICSPFLREFLPVGGRNSRKKGEREVGQRIRRISRIGMSPRARYS